MTASELKAYLAERGRASLGDIAIHFGSSPDAVRQAAQLWVGKGRLRAIEGSGCKTGCNCGHKPETVYEWVG